jgi:PKD repeat protein
MQNAFRTLLVAVAVLMTSCSNEISVTAPNQAPVAKFSISSTQGVAPFTVNVDAGESSDTDGSVVTYAWDFGDGGTATGVTASHVYQAAGPFTVSLTVTDDDGASARATTLVDVAAPGPTARRWSDPATWGGAVPGADDDVTIPVGRHVLLDVDTAPLGGLMVLGTLEFARQDLELTADWVMVHGALQVGTEAQPFMHRATITLTGDDPNEDVMGMGTRGLMVMGGTLDLHGTPPMVAWTKLADHVAAGATEVPVLLYGEWRPGDELAIAPTDFYGASQTERVTIQSVGGPFNTIMTVNPPLAAARWGRLQYVTSAGMSLTPDGSVTAPAEPTPLRLDERAEVANLTRNVVIQAPDDALWRNQGFGAHVMIMDLASTARVNGVEFRRSGQRGILGRYPIHWHRLSYRDDGTTIGDATGHYVRNSTINVSTNRCVTIHATNGLEVSNNVCYDVIGQAMFTEDAVERRNLIEGNLVLKVRNPAPAEALKRHDFNALPNGGSSGFWISNPDNVVRGNVAADAEGFGFWLSFPRNPVGPSANVPIHPDRTQFGVFEYNTAHSVGREGVMLDFAEVNDQGNVQANRYISTTDGQDPVWPFPNQRRFSLHRVTAWKNRFGGIWDRVLWPDITECVVADNNGRFIAGSGEDGRVTRCLAVGTSLNDTPRPAGAEVPTAFATYHSTFDLRENVAVNFPLVPGERSGVFSTEDYYIRPVDKGHARNPGNLWIASHPGYRVQRNPSFALAGALWDPFGTWGPAGNWSGYDTPFFTHGATCQPVAPAATSGAASCDGGPYYGAINFVLDQANSRFAATFPIEVTRYDAALNPIGTWSVAQGDPAVGLVNMRHFAAVHGGVYLLDFPGSPLPGDVGFDLENMLDANATAVIGVRFSGADPAQVYASTNFNYLDPAQEAAPDSGQKHTYAAVANLAAVIVSAGETYWQDTANDVVWIKLRGGLQQPWSDADYHEFTDQRLYRLFHLRIH